LHVEIMGKRHNHEIDHINGDALDNRRCNLRFCTRSQNQANTLRQRPAVSGFRGVYPHGRKWQALIKMSGRLRHLGIFEDAVTAAKAWDRAARRVHGNFARLNFPHEE
jgi:hypothetical protein